MSRIGIALLAAAIVVTASATTSIPASARTVYDGRWSVLIVTDKGSCDRAYRYGFDIRNGNVQYDGDVVDLTGRVAANGFVRVVVSRDGQSASGVGRLSRNFGQGTWRGTATGASCSGHWEAERR